MLVNFLCSNYNCIFAEIKVKSYMGRITKRFFNGDGQNGESCLFIGSYKRKSERGK